MAKPPFQQHHFPHRGHLQPRLLPILTNGQLSLEPRGRWHSHGTSGGAALAKAEKKGCAPQQCSCPSSCSQLSLSQQLGMASLDTEGKGRQIPFVKLIPNILPYTHTLQRVSVRAQLIRARITPGMKWWKHNGSWCSRHRSKLYPYKNPWFGSYFPPLPPVNCFRGPGGICIIACRRKQPQVVSFSTHRRAHTHAQFFLNPLLTPSSASILSYQLIHQGDQHSPEIMMSDYLVRWHA